MWGTDLSMQAAECFNLCMEDDNKMKTNQVCESEGPTSGTFMERYARKGFWSLIELNVYINLSLLQSTMRCISTLLLVHFLHSASPTALLMWNLTKFDFYCFNLNQMVRVRQTWMSLTYWVLSLFDLVWYQIADLLSYLIWVDSQPLCIQSLLFCLNWFYKVLGSVQQRKGSAEPQPSVTFYCSRIRVRNAL